MTKKIPQFLPAARLAGLALLLSAAFAASGPTVEPTVPVPAEHSALWGPEGERWVAASRLPDFSYAGYRRGEAALPERETEDALDVRDFGARGNGETDDTGAFRRAIAAASGKVLRVPRGRYRIAGFLDIASSGTVLRGDGPGDSVLVFPIPLNEIEPNWGATTTGRRTSNYSWSGGFLRVRGSFSRQELARVDGDAKRGDRALTLANCEGIAAGDELRLELRDTPEQALARHVYAGDPGPIDNLGTRVRVVFHFRVTGLDLEDRRLHFDRPLRTDVRPEWNPVLYAARSSVEEVGIERLGFEFPETPYRGHFTERGFNAIAFGGARNCWVRDVAVRNADSGIFVSGANITIRGLAIESSRPPEKERQATGHHGVTLGGQDNLLEGFEVRTRFMHDVTVTRGSAGNVVASGRGPDLCFDHHRYGPHANLFTDIDIGEGSRMFQSGGGAALGRHSGAWTTFWCIRARRPQRWPTGWGPDRMQLIGVPADGPSVTEPDGRWFEAIDPAALRPRNLYRAQLEKRLSGQSPGSAGSP